MGDAKEPTGEAGSPATAAAAASSPTAAPGIAKSPKSRSGTSSPRAGTGIGIDDGIIHAEEVVDDGESALAASIATYTTSLASSVFNYPVEHGRRYHAYQDGRYTRPNDEMEMDRLLILHTIVTTAQGSLYLAPIDTERPQRILDIGTGNGVWAIEMGDNLPNSIIIGNDLSANMPAFVPPNVKFEVDDVENEWVYDQPFSYIFCRYMAASISDWPQLIRRTFENIEPGGWAEFQDFDLTYYSEDGSLAPDNPLLTWITTACDAAEQIGRDTRPGSKLQGWFKETGFTNVTHRRFKLPIGTWPKDPVLKQIGLYNYMQINQGLEGLSMRLFTNVLKWTQEQVVVMLADVRKQLHDPNIHAILDFHVVYGQKPE